MTAGLAGLLAIDGPVASGAAAAALHVVLALTLRAVLAAFLLLVSALIGHGLLPARLRPHKAVERVPLDLSFGLLATGWLSWVLGSWLGTWAVGAVWVALAAATAHHLRTFLRDLGAVGRRLWHLLRASPVLAVALVVAVVVLVPALALPLVDSDGIRYQVAQPRLHLLTGHIETYRWDVTGYFPQVGSMLYLVATALGGGETCKLAHALIALIAAATLALFVHRGRATRAAALAAPLLLLSAPVAASPATAAFVDHFALFHLAVATVLVAGSAAPAAVGLALGAAFATKLVVAPAVLGVAIAAWARSPRGTRMRALASLSGAAALAFLPFAVRNVALTGDPFFPLGLGLLGRALPGITAAGLHWTVEYRAAARGFLAFGWFQGQPGTGWDDVVGPWVLVALFASPLVVAVRRLRVLLALVVPSLLVASLWHPPARYFMVLLWALAAILATALARVVPRFQSVAALALAGSALVPAAPHLLADLGALPHLLGRISREAVIERDVPGYRATRVVASLPRGTVMALDFPAPYYFDRPWIVEGVLNQPPLATWLAEGEDADALLEKLHGLGVRQVVVTPGYGGGTSWSLLALAKNPSQTTIMLALRAHLQLVATVDGVDVYEVPP